MWEYRATLHRLIDGDTLSLLIDTGFGGRQEEQIRLLNVSAPEMLEPGGREARRFVADWWEDLLPPARRFPLLVQTVPNSNPEPDERRTFTRYLGVVMDIQRTTCLNDEVNRFLAGHPEWGPGRLAADGWAAIQAAKETP